MADGVYVVVLLFGSIAFAIPGANMAKRKGYEPWVGVVIAGALWLLGLLIIALIPPNRGKLSERIAEDSTESLALSRRVQATLKGTDESLVDPWERDTYG